MSEEYDDVEDICIICGDKALGGDLCELCLLIELGER